MESLEGFDAIWVKNQNQGLSEENNEFNKITDEKNDNQGLLEKNKKVEDRIEDVTNVLEESSKLGELSPEKSQNVLGEDTKLKNIILKRSFERILKSLTQK